MMRTGAATRLARRTLLLLLLEASLVARPVFSQPSENKHEHSHDGTADTSKERATPVARQLWADLYCMCGECDNITLAECACENAAKERKRIAEEVEKLGLGSPERDVNARAKVLGEYIARHGAKAEVSYAKLHRWLDPLLMLGGVLAGSLGVFILVERLRSARRASASPATRTHKFKPSSKRRNKRRGKHS